MRLDNGRSGETSAQMRRTVANGVYAIAEYASQPVGLLLSVPYLLRHMGAAQFGVWVLASSAVNGGNALSTGSQPMQRSSTSRCIAAEAMPPV